MLRNLILANEKIKLKKKILAQIVLDGFKRHLNDEFVIKSKIEGYRSRSSYKLIKWKKNIILLNIHKIFRPWMRSVGGFKLQKNCNQKCKNSWN